MPVTAETIEKLLAQIAELTEKLNTALEQAQIQHEKDTARIEALTKKIEELTGKKTRKDSHNSSMPPSSDGYGKPAPKSLREKSGKKAGGQPGHKGNSMEITREPDEVKEYLPGKCMSCPMASSCAGKYSCAGRRYEYDVKVTTTLTEHRVLACECPLEKGGKIAGEFPEEITSSKQYGTELKAIVLSLFTIGYMSVNRIKEFLNGFQIPISTGTIQNILSGCVEKVSGAVNLIRERVSGLSVINCDETGTRTNGKLHWIHCLCNDKWTYMVIHEKRGSKALEDIGILPELDGCTIIHDFWKAYLDYSNVFHGFCNAHLQRELVYAFESTRQGWAKDLKDLLTEMNVSRDRLIAAGQARFPQETLKGFLTRYDNLIAAGIEKNPIPKKFPGERGRPGKGKTRCLLERMRDYKEDILRFVTNWSIPFTNNEAERTIRFTKVKQKVSGCFRTECGADGFVKIMSYLSTARKHGVNAHYAFIEALNGRAMKLVESWD